MTPTDECNCLSSPNALYGPCEACSRQREERKMASENESLKPEWHMVPPFKVVQVSSVDFAVCDSSPEDDPDGRAIAHCVFRGEAEYVADALNRIPPAQADESAPPYGRCDTCGAICDVNGCVIAACHQIAKTEPAQAEPMKWVPQPGEKVLVAATITEFSTDVEDEVFISIRDGLGRDWATTVPLSQLRPLPVVQGGD